MGVGGSVARLVPAKNKTDFQSVVPHAGPVKPPGRPSKSSGSKSLRNGFVKAALSPEENAHSHRSCPPNFENSNSDEPESSKVKSLSVDGAQPAFSTSLKDSFDNSCEISPETFNFGLTEGQCRRGLMADCEFVCSPIFNNVFVSGSKVATSWEALNENKITRVVNCSASVVECVFESERNVKYLPLSMVDGRQDDITWFVCEVIQFLEDGRQAGERTLVHCEKGISRSCSFAIAYHMWSTGTSWKQSFDFVKSRRPVCAPNTAFSCNLIEINDLLFGEASRTPLMLRCAAHLPHDPNTPVLKICRDPGTRRLLAPCRSMLNPRGAYVVRVAASHPVLYIWHGPKCAQHAVEATAALAGLMKGVFCLKEADLVFVRSDEESEDFWTWVKNDSVFAENEENELNDLFPVEDMAGFVDSAFYPLSSVAGGRSHRSDGRDEQRSLPSSFAMDGIESKQAYVENESVPALDPRLSNRSETRSEDDDLILVANTPHRGTTHQPPNSMKIQLPLLSLDLDKRKFDLANESNADKEKSSQLALRLPNIRRESSLTIASRASLEETKMDVEEEGEDFSQKRQKHGFDVGNTDASATPSTRPGPPRHHRHRQLSVNNSQSIEKAAPPRIEKIAVSNESPALTRDPFLLSSRFEDAYLKSFERPSTPGEGARVISRNSSVNCLCEDDPPNVLLSTQSTERPTSASSTASAVGQSGHIRKSELLSNSVHHNVSSTEKRHEQQLRLNQTRQHLQQLDHLEDHRSQGRSPEIAESHLVPHPPFGSRPPSGTHSARSDFGGSVNRPKLAKSPTPEKSLTSRGGLGDESDDKSRSRSNLKLSSPPLQLPAKFLETPPNSYRERVPVDVGLSRGPTQIQDLVLNNLNSSASRASLRGSRSSADIGEGGDQTHSSGTANTISAGDQSLGQKSQECEAAESANVKKLKPKLYQLAPSSVDSNALEWEAMGVYDDQDLTENLILLLTCPDPPHFLWIGGDWEHGDVIPLLQRTISASWKDAVAREERGKNDKFWREVMSCVQPGGATELIGNCGALQLERGGEESELFWSKFCEGF